jgi:dTDP-4-dehydrorhamnose reductase
MNVLILGGAGMLGHKVFQHLKDRLPDTWCTVRGSVADAHALAPSIFAANLVGGVDAADWPALERLLREHRPRVIVNCIGVIKQRSEAKSAVPSITINALLPHRLAELCQRWDARLIHFSTDCVFSGERGNYTEDDFSDAHDLYGRTKFLGEVSTRNALTLRTSIIGRELTQFRSLLEWFLAEAGRNGEARTKPAHGRRRVQGFARAFYSGVTTNYLAELVGQIITAHPQLHGLYQVTSDTISKFELLTLLRDAFHLDCEIQPQEEFFCDRSMKGDKFVAATGLRTPPWHHLAAQLANDPTPYEEWRKDVHKTI